MFKRSLSRWFRASFAKPLTRGNERKPRLSPLRLEDRLAPATFTATINPSVNNTAAVNELIGFVNKANVTNEPDTIVLWPNATYTFANASDTGDGASALPAIIQDGAGKNPVTIQGNGATLFRDSANTNNFRFFRVTGINADLIVTDLTMKGGLAKGTGSNGSGGAISATSNATLNVIDSTFIGNSSAADGGAVAVLNGANGSASSFVRSTFTGNSATGNAGAVIATSFGFASFADCMFTNNSSAGGAGGVAGNGFLVFDFTRVTFTGNSGLWAGAFQGAEANFNYCTVTNNTTSSGGTGGLDAVLSNIYVGYSTISNNVGQSSVSSGGGINGSKVVVVNSTIDGNKSGAGGGISGSDVTLLYSVVTNNTSTFGIASAGGVKAGSSITMSHSVVAGNINTSTTSDIADLNVASTFTSQGFNFIGIKPATLTVGATDIVGSVGSPANPQLGPLQNNGGLTLTRAPLAGSPLIGAGSATIVSPVTTDQRGYPRLVGAKADIGAVEVQATNGVGVVSGNLQSTKITTGFANTLQAMVTDPNGNPVSGATVVFSGPSFGAAPDFGGAGPVQSAVTNSSGIASISVSANGIAGVYPVSVSVGALPPVSLTLRNTNFALTQPPTFGTVTGSAGTGQSAVVNTAYASPVSITLASGGSPAANVPVTFTAPVSGAGAKFSNGGTSITVLTNASGVASVPFTANTKAGAFTITASATGFGSATYAETNLAGSAASISVLSGTGQTAFLNSWFGFPLLAQVFDAFGNPSPNQTVTFTPPSTGASATFTPNTAISDGAGFAQSTTPTANATGGTYIVTATVGSASANFTLTNLAPPPPPPPANTAPVISSVNNQTTTTGIAVGPIAFVVTDLETPAANLVVTAASSNLTLVPLANIVLGGSGANRTITVTPAAGQTGTATITLTVTDGGTLTATTSFTVTVNAPILTPPTITPIGNQTIITGTTAGPLGFVIGDIQTPASNLLVSVVAANTTLFPVGSVVLGGSGANRTVTLTSPQGLIGSSLVTLTVTDTDGMTAQSSFTVTVTTPPAGPPSITGLSNVTIPINKTGGPYTLIVTDPLTAANNLTVSATSSNTTLLPVANITFGGSGNFRTISLAPIAGQSGTSIITVTVTNAANLTASQSFTLTVPPLPPLPPQSGFVAGTSEGIPAVSEQLGVDGKLIKLIQPFDPTYDRGARVARGDFNGDGTLDVAIGTGPGTSSKVRIFDGATGALLSEVRPFESSFLGGVFVAAGDINGDGKADLVVTPDVGGSSRTVIYNGGDPTKQMANFFAIEDPDFRGGARCAVGDMNKDGKADVLIAAGFGGGPRIAGYDGASIGAQGGNHLFPDFFAFDSSLTNGTYVAIGDLNGDGYGDVVVGAGPGGGPRVTVFSGSNLTKSDTFSVLADFFAGSPDSRYGVRVATANLDGDGNIDLVTGNGGGPATVNLFLGSSSLFGTPTPSNSYDPYAGSTNGVFVG